MKKHKQSTTRLAWTVSIQILGLLIITAGLVLFIFSLIRGMIVILL